MIRSAKSIALSKQSENCELHAYPDPASGGDPWTIGWGATGPNIHKGVIWTQKQADDWLTARMASDDAAITKALNGAKTTQGQFDALADFVYNEGLNKLLNSTLFHYHLTGKYAAAADEFPKWNLANNRVMPGLVTRRAAERALYMGTAK
jgi:lysozyme